MIRRMSIAACCAAALILGCGKKVSEQDRKALDVALVSYWQKRDAKAEVRVKEARIEGDKASITFSLKFPEFHSISTTRTGELVRENGQWSVVRVSE